MYIANLFIKHKNILNLKLNQKLNEIGVAIVDLCNCRRYKFTSIVTHHVAVKHAYLDRTKGLPTLNNYIFIFKPQRKYYRTQILTRLDAVR